MVKCDVCNKKMPEKVLEAHKKKRHLEKVVTGGFITEEQSTQKVEYPFYQVSNEKIEKIGCDCPCKKTTICGTCSREVSELVIPYHLHVIHGL